MEREKTFQSEQMEREAILRTLQSLLEAQPTVVFAYVHGSFVEGRPFHDIDIAVYLNPEDEGETDLIALDLALELEKALARMYKQKIARIPIDVRVLNWASLGFCYHVLRGKRLFSRDEATHTRWVEQILLRYLDLKPLQQRALKEAMTA